VNSKSDNKLNSKDYLFLIVCLLVYFLGSIYLLSYEDIATGDNAVYLIVGAVVLAIPTTIYMLKSIN
jgi:hypothetical protein